MIDQRARHRRGARLRPLAVAALAVAILGVGASAIVASTTSSASTSPAPIADQAQQSTMHPTTASSATPTTAAAPQIVVHQTANTLAQGAAVAGDTITPGLWVTDGGKPFSPARNPGGCRWSRNRGASWETSGMPTQHIVISLRAGAQFETYGCAPWHVYRAY